MEKDKSSSNLNFKPEGACLYAQITDKRQVVIRVEIWKICFLTKTLI